MAPRRRGRRTLAAIAAGILVTALSACGSGSEGGSGEEITIGVLQPLSGIGAYAGTASLNGVKLAIQEINDAGGIKALGGAKLTMKSADSGSTDVNTATNTATQIANDDPAAIVGPANSGIYIPASTVWERNRIPSCSSSYANQITDRGYKYIFQLPTKAADVANTTVTMMPQVLPLLGSDLKKVAIIFQASVPSTADVGRAVASGLEQSGYEVVYSQGITEPLTSAQSLATGIKASGAQLLVNGIGTNSDLLLLQQALASQNVTIPNILPGGALGVSETFQEVLKDDANGFFTVAQWAPNVHLSDEQDKLLANATAAYHEMFGQEMDQFSGIAYQCTWLFARAMETAKSADPTAIRDVLASGTFSSGPESLMPGGTVKFDDVGVNTGAVNVMSEWCGGKISVVYPQEYATMPVTQPDQCQ